jgi:hypothetical protein
LGWNIIGFQPNSREQGQRKVQGNKGEKVKGFYSLVPFYPFTFFPAPVCAWDKVFVLFDLFCVSGFLWYLCFGKTNIIIMQPAICPQNKSISPSLKPKLTEETRWCNALTKEELKESIRAEMRTWKWKNEHTILAGS